MLQLKICWGLNKSFLLFGNFLLQAMDLIYDHEFGEMKIISLELLTWMIHLIHSITDVVTTKLMK